MEPRARGWGGQDDPIVTDTWGWDFLVLGARTMEHSPGEESLRERPSCTLHGDWGRGHRGWLWPLREEGVSAVPPLLLLWEGLEQKINTAQLFSSLPGGWAPNSLAC